MVKRVAQKNRKKVKLQRRKGELQAKAQQRKTHLAQAAARKRKHESMARAREAGRATKRMYQPGLRVLLVGEGNFSFARAMIRRWEAERLAAEKKGEIAPAAGVEDLVGWNMVATCLDSKEELTTKYPDVKDIVREIKAFGVTVLTGVDATDLIGSKRVVRAMTELCESHRARKKANAAPTAEDLLQYGMGSFTASGEGEEGDEDEDEDAILGFDRVIFNFPHLGQGISDKEQSIATHREFLERFLLSAHAVLAKDGQVHITLKTGEPYDSWRVPKIATTTGLYTVHSAVPFDPAQHDGYSHRRTVGAPENELEANVDVHSDKTTSRTLVFARADAVSGTAKSSEPHPSNGKGRARRGSLDSYDSDAESDPEASE